MTAPLNEDRSRGDAPRQNWREELNDLLEHAELPPPPENADPLRPSDAELRAAFEVEQREAFVVEEWKQRMGFDFWCLRQFAITAAAETAEERHTAIRGLQAAGNIRRFAEEEIEDANPCNDEHCKHGHDEDSKTRVAKYRAVIENVAILETRIRSLNPEAAADFDAQRA